MLWMCDSTCLVCITFWCACIFIHNYNTWNLRVKTFVWHMYLVVFHMGDVNINTLEYASAPCYCPCIVFLPYCCFYWHLCPRHAESSWRSRLHLFAQVRTEIQQHICIASCPIPKALVQRHGWRSYYACLKLCARTQKGACKSYVNIGKETRMCPGNGVVSREELGCTCRLPRTSCRKYPTVL